MQGNHCFTVDRTIQMTLLDRQVVRPLKERLHRLPTWKIDGEDPIDRLVGFERSTSAILKS